MEFRNRQDPLLLGFLLLSLLLHLALLYLVPEGRLAPSVPEPEEPVYVEMREAPEKPKPRELDLPVPEKETPRETPAKRLGPADQVVEKETAPEGTAPEDRAPAPAVSAPSPSQPQPAPEPAPRREPSPEPQKKPAARETSQPEARLQPKAEARPEPERPSEKAPQQRQAPPQQLPDLKTLTRLPQTTTARLEDQMRRKYREEVEKGDAVWLDTERDLLFSFFRRFRDNIYTVWNYPREAAERGAEGTCLLRVTLYRDGTVKNVKLEESSGHAELDREAVAAVWKGAPYGDLPQAYQEDTLTIFAFFQYNLTRKFIYGAR